MIGGPCASGFMVSIQARLYGLTLRRRRNDQEISWRVITRFR